MSAAGESCGIGTNILKCLNYIRHFFQPSSTLSRMMVKHFSKPLKKSGVITWNDAVTTIKPIYLCKLSEENVGKIAQINTLMGDHQLAEFSVWPESDFDVRDDFIAWYAFATKKKVCGVIEYIGYYELYSSDEVNFKCFLARDEFDQIKNGPEI